MGDEGLEPPSNPHYTSAILKEASAESGALAPPDPALISILAAWPTLPPAIKAGILALVEAAK